MADSNKWFTLSGKKGIVNIAVFPPGGEEMVVYFTSLKGSDMGIHAFSLTPKGCRHIFSLPDRAIVLRFNIHGDRFLITGPRTKGAKLFDRRGKILGVFMDGFTITKGCFLEGEGKILLGSPRNGVFLLGRDGRILQSFHDYSTYLIALDAAPDGRAFLYASRGGLLLVREGNGRLLFRYRVAEPPLRGACFSPGGKRILCYTHHSLTILDAVSGRTLLKIRQEGKIWRAGFTPSGRRIWFFFRKTQFARILPVDQEDILRAAEDAAGKGFTPREKEAYRSLLEGD